MKAPNINTAKGLAKLIQSQIQLAKIGEATGDEFNWEKIIKDYAKKQVKLFSSKPDVIKSVCDCPLPKMNEERDFCYECDLPIGTER